MENQQQVQQTNRQKFDAGKPFQLEGSDQVAMLCKTPHGTDYVGVQLNGAYIFAGTVVKYGTYGVIMDLFGDLVICPFSEMIFK